MSSGQIGAIVDTTSVESESLVMFMSCFGRDWLMWFFSSAPVKGTMPTKSSVKSRRPYHEIHNIAETGDCIRRWYKKRDDPKRMSAEEMETPRRAVAKTASEASAPSSSAGLAKAVGASGTSHSAAAVPAKRAAGSEAEPPAQAKANKVVNAMGRVAIAAPAKAEVATVSFTKGANATSTEIANTVSDNIAVFPSESGYLPFPVWFWTACAISLVILLLALWKLSSLCSASYVHVKSLFWVGHRITKTLNKRGRNKQSQVLMRRQGQGVWLDSPTAINGDVKLHTNSRCSALEAPPRYRCTLDQVRGIGFDHWCKKCTAISTIPTMESSLTKQCAAVVERTTESAQ